MNQVDTLTSFLEDPLLLQRLGDNTFCNLLDEEFDEHLKLVRETFDWPKERNNEKGKRLEHLGTYLLNRLKCVEVVHDLIIESNQIDHKITLTPLATFHPFLKEIGLNFISECKNQRSSIDVGQVQKVACLVEDHNLKFAVFFSRTKIAGKGWADAEGKRKKIYCRKQHAIINFTLDELEAIRNNNLNLLTEMRKKYEQLKFEVESDEVSISEPDWHEDPIRIKAVLEILHAKGFFTLDELQEKLSLIN